MQIKKYKLKDALLFILENFNNFSYVTDCSLKFELNSTNEMQLLRKDLEKHKIINDVKSISRNNIIADLDVDKAKDLYSKLKP